MFGYNSAIGQAERRCGFTDQPTFLCGASFAVPLPRPRRRVSSTSAATSSPQPVETATPALTASPAVPSEAPPSTAPSSPSGSCAPGNGPTTHTAAVSTPETWTAADSPHVITFDLTISAQLTLEPCVEVRLPAGRGISINATGSIVANGDEARHIVITADQPGTPFTTIRAVGGGSLHLSYVDISGGGDPGNARPSDWGTIYMQGVDGAQPTQSLLFVDHVSITDSASNGLLLRDGAGFAVGSTQLSVSGAAAWPVAIWGRAAGTLPDGSYTGNAQDVITLLDADGGGSILQSLTLHNLGVPFLVGGESSSGGLRVTAPQGANETSVLTIDPGVTLMFRPNGIMEVEHFTGDFPALGAVVARGTPEQPIVFTSAAETPAAGDWYGLRFGLTPSDQNVLDNVRIEYAGTGSPASGARCHPNTNTYTGGVALAIYGRPPTVFLTNSTIFASAGHGIERRWLGKLLDFKPTNKFDQVAGCDQT